MIWIELRARPRSGLTAHIQSAATDGILLRLCDFEQIVSTPAFRLQDRGS
jgi:hypothetical protein